MNSVDSRAFYLRPKQFMDVKYIEWYIEKMVFKDIISKNSNNIRIKTFHFPNKIC